MAKMSDLPPDARKQLDFLEMARRFVLFEIDPPDCMLAFEILQAKARLLRAHGLLKPPS
jgi:hypothetical protein